MNIHNKLEGEAYKSDIKWLSSLGVPSGHHDWLLPISFWKKMSGTET